MLFIIIVSVWVLSIHTAGWCFSNECYMYVWRKTRLCQHISFGGLRLVREQLFPPQSVYCFYFAVQGTVCHSPNRPDDFETQESFMAIHHCAVGRVVVGPFVAAWRKHYRQRTFPCRGRNLFDVPNLPHFQVCAWRRGHHVLPTCFRVV